MIAPGSLLRCPACHGKGRIHDTVCQKSAGSGLVEDKGGAVVKTSITLEDRDWDIVCAGLHGIGGRAGEILDLIQRARHISRMFGGLTPEKIAAYNDLTPEQIKAAR